MKDTVTELVSLVASQSITLQAIADTVAAMKTTLIFHYPELEGDLKEQIHLEQKKSRESVAQIHSNLSKLREAISRLPS